MGSKPQAPKPVQPTVYQTFVPLKSYEQTADYMNRLKEQTNQLWSQLGTQSGSSWDLAARQAQVRAQAAESYQASLPSGDKYLAQTTGVQNPYANVRGAADAFSEQARNDYLAALQEKDKTDPALEQISTPSWATSTIKV